MSATCLQPERQRSPSTHRGAGMRRTWRLIGCCLAMASATLANAATDAEVDAMINRARQALVTLEWKTHEQSLAAYALLKTGTHFEDPVIQKAVEAVRTKCKGDVYGRGVLRSRHHSYEAAVDAILLQAMEDESDKPHLELIAKGIIAAQHSQGAWAYIQEADGVADTSVTQYAILGLWAAQRAGVDIPVRVWAKTARWHLATQIDGGFAYRFHDSPVPTNTMSVAGAGTMHVLRMMIPASRNQDRAAAAAARGPARRRFNILDPLNPNPPPAAPVAPSAPEEVTVSLSSLDEAITRAKRHVEVNLPVIDSSVTRFDCYYLYAIERLGALSGQDSFGPHDWYQFGCDWLVPRQSPTGTWNDTCGEVAATSFALLFLGRATASLVKTPRGARLVGGGVLIAGRGLPDKLNAAKLNDGKVQGQTPAGDLQQLLDSLDRAQAVEVGEVEQVVEQIDLSNREALVGQVERLKRLSRDPRVDVRRVACWALGRSGDLGAVPELLDGLRDLDLSVAVEASRGLCTLSRSPVGLGPVIDPNVLLEDAPEAEHAALIEKWRNEAVKVWTEWYLSTRPYRERDARTDIGPNAAARGTGPAPAGRGAGMSPRGVKTP